VDLPPPLGGEQVDEPDTASDGDDRAGEQCADHQQDGAQPVDVHAERGRGLVVGQQGVEAAAEQGQHDGARQDHHRDRGQLAPLGADANCRAGPHSWREDRRVTSPPQ
jgi:hypothetical protein